LPDATSYTRPVANRDEILAFASELLDLDAYPDYGPMGLQVAGAQEVGRIACGVSASLEVFERAAKAGAQMLIVHHGPALGPRLMVARASAWLACNRAEQRASFVESSRASG
jgi:putative NIF3 family GTP cyclohydrolase 1 type 2